MSGSMGRRGRGCPRAGHVRGRCHVALVAVASLLLGLMTVVVGPAGPASADPATLPPDELKPTGTFTFPLKGPSDSGNFDSQPYAWWDGLAKPVPLLGVPSDGALAYVNTPALSPDGRLVAIETTTTPNQSEFTPGYDPRKVSVYRVGGTEPLWTVPVDPRVKEHSSVVPTWSPDGRRLAFIRNMWDGGSSGHGLQSVWVADADGTNMREIDMDWHGYRNWAPGGQSIITVLASSLSSAVVRETNVDTGATNEVASFNLRSGQGSFDGFATAIPGEFVAGIRTNSVGAREVRRYSYGGDTDGRSTGIEGGVASLSADGAVFQFDRIWRPPD